MHAALDEQLPCAREIVFYDDKDDMNQDVRVCEAQHAGALSGSQTLRRAASNVQARHGLSHYRQLHAVHVESILVMMLPSI